jgi:hypothetical protein
MPLDHISIFAPKAKVEDMVTFLTSSLEHLGFKVMYGNLFPEILCRLSTIFLLLCYILEAVAYVLSPYFQ